MIAKLWARLRAANPPWVLLGAWLIAIAYAFPGYMNWDASSQEAQARVGAYDDMHPALMAVLWHFVEKLVHGPFGMLVIQTALFLWGLYDLLRRRYEARTAAWIAGALLLFPPILTPMAVVWKDAQMAGFLMAGFALVLHDSWRARAAGIACLFMGVGVRHNAPFALPPICLLAVAAWGVRRKLAIVGLAAVLAIALSLAAFTVNAKLSTRTYWWSRSVAIHDIVGTLCHAGPMSDDEIRDELPGVALLVDHDIQHAMCAVYTPRIWFALAYGDARIFSNVAPHAEYGARQADWIAIIRRHPRAFLAHRWAVMREVLGLVDNGPWEPACEEFGADHDTMLALSQLHSQSGFQVEYGELATWLSGTIAYRPWAYALLGLLLFGYALRRRDTLLAAMLASGFLLEVSYFIGASAPDYRYSHWMVTCCCFAAVVVFGERLRSHR